MSVRVLVGDCLDVLSTLPAESVHCVVTSPPYWGLRDYGLPPLVFGGDPACAHEWGEGLRIHKGGPHGATGTLLGGSRSVVEAQAATKDIQAGQFCARCGAWAGALGLEPTPELYVEHMVDLFREVRRVLRDDGTLWLNLGDCYATGAGRVGDHPGGGERGAKWAGRALRNGAHAGKHTAIAAMGPMTQPNRMPLPGLKPKDLVGVPWRVAFALQADGWWLRSDIIWHKPNPMPESVTDRPTKAHEYVFLLTKSERYFYDADAIREPHVDAARYDGGGAAGVSSPDYDPRRPALVRVPFAMHGRVYHPAGRKRRTVWTITPKPFPAAHFATFPPELPEPCIKAGCPQDGTVLDPFAGAGTTGVVALRLGRSGGATS